MSTGTPATEKGTIKKSNKTIKKEPVEALGLLSELSFSQGIKDPTNSRTPIAKDNRL